MAAILWEAGLVAAHWAVQCPMPAAYAYTTTVAVFAIPHYFPDVSKIWRSPLDLTLINATDIDMIFNELSIENHGTWESGTDLRPDILGKIYYDNTIDKELPKNRIECERLSNVIDLYFAERETKDGALRVYKDGMALDCREWYGGNLPETAWPDIIDTYLENELRKPPDLLDCGRPWSECRRLGISLSPLAPRSSIETTLSPTTPSSTTPSPANLPTLATVNVETTRTVTVTIRGLSSVTHSPGCPMDHFRHPSNNPTRTVPICVYTTKTTTLPVITNATSTVWETHHVIGTESTPFSIDEATTTGDEDYICKLPACATSTSIDWQTVTTTSFYPEGFHLGTDIPHTTAVTPELTADTPEPTADTPEPTANIPELPPGGGNSQHRQRLRRREEFWWYERYWNSCKKGWRDLMTFSWMVKEVDVFAAMRSLWESPKESLLEVAKGISYGIVYVLIRHFEALVFAIIFACVLLKFLIPWGWWIFQDLVKQAGEWVGVLTRH